MNQRKTKKYMGYSGLLVILLIAIDQFTKWLAYTHLYQKPDVSVICLLYTSPSPRDTR